MAIIDTIIQLNITRETAKIDIAAFDIPLILVAMDANMEAEFKERVRTYHSIEGVAEDFPLDHPAYIIAEKLMGVDNPPNTFKIGKKREGETYSRALHAVREYDDTWWALLSDASSDDDIDELAGAIQSMRKGYFVSTDTALAFEQQLNPIYSAKVEFGHLNPATGDKLRVRIAGITYESTYYVLVEDEEEVGSWSDWTPVIAGGADQDLVFTYDPETGTLDIQGSQMFVVSKASKITEDGETNLPKDNISATDVEGLDIGQTLRAKGYFRTFVLYSATAFSEYPEAVWVGEVLPDLPGSTSWAYKALPGVTVSNLTDTQVAILDSRGYNYYIPILGVNVTRRGTSIGDGDWVDVIHFVDWLHARIQERVFYRFVTMRKVPFTDDGASVIEGEIRNVLLEARDVNQGISEFSITVPRVSDISIVDKDRRHMAGFKFTATLQGAIDTVRIEGNVHP